MKFTVNAAAELVGGKIFGNGNLELLRVTKIEEAKQGDLSFLYLPSYLKYLENTSATAVIISPKFDKVNKNLTYIEVEKPEQAILQIIQKFFMPKFELNGISETSVISGSAKIDESAAIGENVFIGNNCSIGKGTKIFHNSVIMDSTIIGENCLIHPNVTLREQTEIGNRVIIHSGTVVGSDGFGYSPNSDGSYTKIPQIGNVVIEDDVELGSNVSIDRAALGSTRILKGTKLDNLVQVAHNVTIGKDTVLSAQTGIAGSTKVGSNCIIAGQVGVVGHIEITDNVIIGAQTGVSKSITKSGKYFGYPAKEMATALRLEAHVRNLPKTADKISSLEKRIEELEKQLNMKNVKD